MTDRQNLFRPIHKGIRSMLYAHAARFQWLDYRSVPESNRLVTNLKRDLGDSLSNCLLCLLSVHSKHEERDIFAKLRAKDAGAVDLVMKEHIDISRRIREFAGTCDEVLAAADPAARVELGNRLELEMGDLFSAYMAHLNHEEDWLVPVMWQWFNDTELNAMRAVYYNALPLPLFEHWMRWTLPALHPVELGIFVAGIASDPAPNRLADVLRIAKAVLPPERWTDLEKSFPPDRI